ncbi:MAG: hypothetical protein J6A63_00120, partial [Clostridia bacterium]|nr:hypothetical protein [Clostridia bacterium]
MRRELKRKIAMTAMSCLAVACVSVGGASLVSAQQTIDPALLMENDGTFYMVPGATIRLHQGGLNGIDGNAMRFLFEMSQAQYESMFDENGAYKDGCSVASYIIAEENIDEGLTTAKEIAGDTDVIKTEIPAEKWTSATSKVEGSSATVYYACAYVYNVPQEYYDDNVSSFAIANVSGNELYTSVQSRSISYVADKALESGEYAEKKELLESYLTDKYVWIKNANAEKIVTDFEAENSAYQKLVSGKAYTYFANSTIGATNTTTGDKAAKIITETVGEVEGTYATLNVDSGAFRPIWLQPTMTTSEMQKYYDLGYTLK